MMRSLTPSRSIAILSLLFVLAACSDDTPEDAAVRDGGVRDGSVRDGAVADTADPLLCGNGAVDAAEDCDGTDLAGQDCASLGFEGGALSCTSCRFDLSACTSTLAVVVAANQDACEAPCTVFLDASGTTGLAADDFVASSFVWDFGVGGVASDRHPVALGFLVAHTFTEAGTYDVRVNVRDTEGRAGTGTQRVTVTAPSAALHVATGGSDSASGALDAPLATVAAALGRRAAGQPIRLKRGDTFTSAGLDLSDESLLLLSAYTDPGDPSDERPRVVLTTDGIAISMDRTTDVRLEGLHVVAASASTGISLAESMRATILGLELEGVRSLESLSIYSVSADSITVADTHIFDFDGYGIFGGGVQQAIIGCEIVDFGGHQHGIRINGGDQIYLAESFVSGGPEVATSYTLRGAGTGSTLTNVVVVGNHSMRSTSASPQNFEEDERVSAVLFEGNTYEGGLNIAAQNVVVRNNRFFRSPLAIDTRHPLLPDGFLRDYIVEHNTGYIDSTDETTFLLVGPRARAVTIRNNAYQTTTPVNYSRFLIFDAPLSELTVGTNHVYMPNIPAPEPYWVIDSGYAPAAWMTATGARTVAGEPRFVSTDASSPEALMIGPGSPCIDEGDASTAALDARGVRRPIDGDGNGMATPDLGCFERAAD